MTTLSSRFGEAAEYAIEVHRGQVRKGNDVPYVAHLFAVASMVLEDGADEDVAIAALLHDAAEDQGGEGRLRDIRDRFGGRVAQIVEACSDTLASPKPPWKERKEAYLKRLANEDDRGVLLVSLADKLHNARSLLRDLNTLGDSDALWNRVHAGKH